MGLALDRLAGDHPGTTRYARTYTICRSAPTAKRYETPLNCDSAFMSYLGVKWSQVQILSARQAELSQVRAGFQEIWRPAIVRFLEGLTAVFDRSYEVGQVVAGQMLSARRVELSQVIADF